MASDTVTFQTNPEAAERIVAALDVAIARLPYFNEDEAITLGVLRTEIASALKEARQNAEAREDLRLAMAYWNLFTIMGAAA